MPATPCTLRPATAADAPAIENLLWATYESTWKPALTVQAAARFENSGRTAAYVRRRLHAMRLAIVGCQVAGLVDWEGDFIDALHVCPAQQRHGIGSRLLALAEAAMAAAGHGQALLETDTFNHAARGFYQRHGYLETGYCPDEEWDSGLTTVKMAKPLGSATPRPG